MKKSWIAVLLLAAGLVTQGAQAAVISLDLSTANSDLANQCTSLVQGTKGCLENGDKASAGGLTATFSSVTPVKNADGSNIDPANGSYIVVDQDGIWFDNVASLPTAGSFGISFSQDLYIKSYLVPFSTTSTNTSGGFQIFLNSVAIAGVNSMVGHGTKTFVDPNYLFMANTVYTVLGSAADLATLKTLTVETVGAAVPEPATLALFGLGLAGIGAVRRRKLAA